MLKVERTWIAEGAIGVMATRARKERFLVALSILLIGGKGNADGLFGLISTRFLEFVILKER